MKDILITGATGFVGSHLVEALGRKNVRARALVRESSDVSLLDRHGIEPVTGDLLDPDSLRRAMGDADTVLHLAAATRALRPDTFHRVNAVGTRRLAQAMADAGGGRRLVYLSSLAAVGPSRGRPVRPDDPPRPLTAYGRSKLEGEEAALGQDGVATAVLRPPAVYGPRDRDLLTFFRLARVGVIPSVGSGERRMQLVHAADLAEAIIRAGERPDATGVFHIAEPTAYRWDEVVEAVAESVGGTAVRVPVPGLVVRTAAAASEAVARLLRRPAIFDRDKALELLAEGWTCETDAAREALGFEATIPLAAGLRETAEWYRTYGWL